MFSYFSSMLDVLNTDCVTILRLSWFVFALPTTDYNNQNVKTENLKLNT